MLHKLTKSTDGGVAVTFGISVAVLVGGMAIAVDFSHGVNKRADLQAAADAAALAGAKELAANTGSMTYAKALAKEVAEKFATSKAPEAKQQIAVSDEDVRVELSTDKKTFFGGITGRQTLFVSVNARAIYDTDPTPCMLALGQDEPSGINMIGSAKVNAPKCVVASNAKGPESIRLQGAPKMTARKVCSSGGTGAKTSPAPQSCKPSPDPFEGKNLHPKSSKSAKPLVKVLTSYSGSCDFTNVEVGANAKGRVQLMPGTYCGGLKIQSADVVLAPGLYVMQEGPLALQGNATVTGLGVSILLSGANAVLDLQGSPALRITAMQTGSMAGIAIASDTPASPTLTSSLQGSPDVTVTGAIYLPNQRLELQGSPVLNMNGPTDTLVALSFRLQGSPDINIKSDSSLMKRSQGWVRLAE